MAVENPPEAVNQNLLINSVVTNNAPDGCRESIENFIRPDQASKRITLKNLNSGRTVVLNCSGADCKVSKDCIFKGDRGFIIGGNI